MRFEFIACKYTSFIQYRKMIEYFFVRVKENLAKKIINPALTKPSLFYQPLIYSPLKISWNKTFHFRTNTVYLHAINFKRIALCHLLLIRL